MVSVWLFPGEESFPWAHGAQFLDAHGSAIAIARDGCRSGLDDMRTIRQSLLHLGDSLRLVWFVLNHCSFILYTGHTGCRNDCDLSRPDERRALHIELRCVRFLRVTRLRCRVNVQSNPPGCTVTCTCALLLLATQRVKQGRTISRQWNVIGEASDSFLLLNYFQRQRHAD